MRFSKQKKKKTNPLPPIENMTEERKKENLDFLKETFLPQVRSFQLEGTFYVNLTYLTYIGYIPGCVGIVGVVVGVVGVVVGVFLFGI